MIASVLVNANKAPQETQKVTEMTNEIFITEKNVDNVLDWWAKITSGGRILRVKRGAQQVASLWRYQDGTAQDYETFCIEKFVTDSASLSQLFSKLERNFELFNGYFHKIDLKLKEPLQLDGPAIQPIDMIDRKSVV